MNQPPRPKLLVLELWGLGDLVIATPFLQAACIKFDVTLLAKPHGKELGRRFFPSVEVVTFVAPWTAFRHKYRLLKWPWRELFRLRELSTNGFDFGVTVRRDPRDHILLGLLHIKKRVGFPRLGTQVLLTESLTPPGPASHRYESWRALARTLDLILPPKELLRPAACHRGSEVLVHTGAGQKARIWPLDRFCKLVTRLENQNYRVRVACDADQREWWLSTGKTDVVTPRTVEQLLALLEPAGAFIGNDSGPGHMAALVGVPTFTLFGPSIPAWFGPLHPSAEWLEGKPCPYKPCWDMCRFPTPNCLWGLDAETVWARIEAFLAKHVRKPY